MNKNKILKLFDKNLQILIIVSKYNLKNYETRKYISSYLNGYLKALSENNLINESLRYNLSIMLHNFVEYNK